MSEIKEPLRGWLELYCNVEAYDPRIIRKAIQYKADNGYEREVLALKAQLREAIDQQTIALEAFEKLTGRDFDEQEDLQAWLLDLWNELYA